MRQYVFYDRESGEVRHVHQVLSAETGKAVEVDEAQLTSLVERMVDPTQTAWLYADVPMVSSRAAVRRVDVRRRRLVTRRLTARQQERVRREEG